MLARVLTVIAIVVLALGVAVGGTILRAGSPSVAALWALDATFGLPRSSDDRSVHVVIHPGESAAEVGQDLEKAGLIRSGLAFRVAIRLSGLDSRLEAGDYDLRPNMPLNQVISVLAQGRMAGGLLTIPEGWRAQEIADALEANHITSRQDFLRVLQRPTFPLPAALRERSDGESLEGFLFPDSYRFTPNTSADQVVQTMVDDFARVMNPDLLGGFRANGLTLDQAVILASIVEREAVVPSERPIIASVYLNRFRRGMRLQSDPTVQYALVPRDEPSAPAGGYWKSELTFADLRVNSPYNTYQVVGLPPGPICNPGLASLQAVAHPATTDYLYFVARPDRTHVFARTLQEHEQNVARYRG